MKNKLKRCVKRTMSIGLAAVMLLTSETGSISMIRSYAAEVEEDLVVDAEI